MPQPAEVDAAAARLIALFRGAQSSIDAQVAAVATNPTQARRRARLLELRRAVDAELDLLETSARAWLEGQMPAVYRIGAVGGAQSIGTSFTWSQLHVTAVQALAEDMFGDVLAATRHVRDDVRSWVRAQGRRQTAAVLLEGQTPQQAARHLTRMAAGEAVDVLGGPVGVIRYADGSYRRMGDYADMLVRTKAALAHNAGSLNTLTDHGVEYVELLDGTGCGLTSHDDPQAANGLVLPIGEAMRYPLAHPRCRRSIVGRVDVRNATEAAHAQPSPTPEQQADQTAAEGVRDEKLAARRARQARRARPARQQRTLRAPRTPRSTPAGPSRLPAGQVPRLTDLLDGAAGGELANALRPVFDGTHAGLTTRVRRADLTASARGSRIDLQGDILDATGPVGTFSRQLHRDPDGTLHVYNAFLQIQPRAQGSGFATQYLGHLEDWYRANGVAHIDVHANIDVGGYTWAKKGFAWADSGGRPDVGNVPGRLNRIAQGITDPAVRAEVTDIASRLGRPVLWGTDEFPTPYEVAMAGHRPGDTLWPGKEALLGSSWHGRKYL